MLGSGMNSAALSWYVLQKTHSPVSLGTLILVQTLPMLLLAPVTGVIADRTDRRRLIMWMDGARSLIIFTVAVLCLLHRETLTELYGMSILVSAATSIFWPTMTALTQELTPKDQYVAANTLLMIGVQGGFLLAGAAVGFVYNRVGLGGVLFADVATYLVSLLCYGLLRKGRHVVTHPADLEPQLGITARFISDTVAGIRYLQGNVYVVLLCTSSAIIFAAIFAQNVVVPPLADQVLHSGPVGFGWINAAWAIGAFLSAGFVPTLVRRFGVRGSVGLTTGLVAAGCAIVPLFSRLWAALLVFLLMGAARGVSVVGLNTGLMEAVPEHYMGRVQNTFAIVSRLMQIVIGMTLGVIAHTIGLFTAFCGLAMVYAIAAIAAAAARSPSTIFEQSAAQTAVVETP